MPLKKPIKSLTVTHTELLSNDMRRIWLATDASSELFKPENEGDYIKLVFTTDSDKPTLRTYTVARVQPDSKTIAIDFVLHDETSELIDQQNGGFAHRFARTAQSGDTLELIGPNTKKSILPNYDGTLFVADSTAVPALESVLRHNDVVGTVVLYNCSTTLVARFEKYNLPLLTASSPDELLNVINTNNGLMVSSVWCAGEYQMMRSVRRYVSDNLQIARENQYFSSYWKLGMTEEGHKVFKQADMQK